MDAAENQKVMNLERLIINELISPIGQILENSRQQKRELDERTYK